MKRIALLVLALIIAAPVFAQKLSKAEKAAQQKALYETAIKCFDEKDFCIIPSSYIDSEGIDNPITDNATFISVEADGKMYLQGATVCGKNGTYVADVTEYTKELDKKGNLKLRMVINGRMIKGTFKVTMRVNTNEANIIFTPTSGTTRKYMGPVVPVAVSGYMKRTGAL